MDSTKKRTYHYEPKSDPVFATLAILHEASTMARLAGPTGVMVPCKDGAAIVSYQRFRGGVVVIRHGDLTIRLSADQALGIAAAILAAGNLSRQHKAISWSSEPAENETI